jgi:uncharacterized metal-binding protein YceD (DUF177 family)
MQIDVTKLLTNQSSRIYLDSEVNIPKNLLDGSRIDDLKNITLKGDMTLNEDNELVLTANVKGIMVLKDDLTLEPVEYNFDTDIEENLPNNQNFLDITDILWQNILVEIPSKVRSTDEDIYLSGDGWRVISENRYNEERSKNNNPFGALDELLKTKEDK